MGFTGNPPRPSLGDYVGGDKAPDMAVSLQDLFILVNQAGIPADQQATAIAIALAESHGDATAYNPVGNDNSYGLWQINMRAHKMKDLGIRSFDELFDPSTNAKAMAIISGNGANWSPWSTFNPGKDGSPPAYLKYLPGVQEQIMNVKFDPANGGNSFSDPNRAGATSPGLHLGSLGIGNFLAMLASGRTWVRVLQVVGGVGVIGFGIYALANKNGAVTDAAVNGAKLAAL